MRQSETFLIIIDEDGKQFAVEGPLTDVQPWNRAVAAAQEGGRNVRTFDIGAASRTAAIREWQRHYGHLYRLVESRRIVIFVLGMQSSDSSDNVGFCTVVFPPTSGKRLVD